MVAEGYQSTNQLINLSTNERTIKHHTFAEKHDSHESLEFDCVVLSCSGNHEQLQEQLRKQYRRRG